MDPTEISNAVKAAHETDATVDGILTLGPGGRRADARGARGQRDAGKVKFGTFDLSPTVLKAIADGKMMFAIDQQQFLQGYLPIEFLRLYKLYGTDAGRHGDDRPGLRHQGQRRAGDRARKKGIR